MSERYAVLVGLSYLDSDKYNGWDGRRGCHGCEADVDFVAGLLQREGFRDGHVRVLKSEEATADAVLTALRTMVRGAGTGDLVTFFYSGHGGQVRDVSGDEVADGRDETLCLFDRQVTDDEIGDIWDLLRADAYGVMVSDSCNSGTIAKARGRRALRPFLLRPRTAEGVRGPGSGGLIQVGAARDGEDAEGWRDGGLFTLSLHRVVAAGLPRGYDPLCERIQQELYGLAGDRQRQQVQCVRWGAVSPGFAGSRPFSLPEAAPGRTEARGDDDDDFDTCGIHGEEVIDPDGEETAPAVRSSAWRLVDRIAEGQVRLRAREKATGKPLSKGVREADKVTGVVLHQTGFARKNVLSDYDGITAHFVIAPDGQTSQIHPIQRLLYASNEFNSHTVSIEFVGNFPTAKGNWWQKFPRNDLTRRQVASGVALLAHLKSAYPQIQRVYGHIQARGKARANDPGPDIWSAVAMRAIADLGYQEDLKIHEKYGGLPIPEAWRVHKPRLVA